jgi:Spy/CpxP family protein refolding chaperone
MNTKKTALLLALGLSIGYSGFSFAADTPANQPAVSKTSVKSNTHNMKDHSGEHKSGMADKQMCDHKNGMKGAQMGGMMGNHEGGHMGGMMGGQMCDHKGEMAGGHMNGMMGSQMGGRMGSHEPGAMMKSSRIDMVMALDLSDEQRAKINKLSDELKHNNWVAMGLVMDESAKLRDLYAADKRDPSAIGKEYQKIFDSERRKIESMIDTQNRIEDLLTPEQRVQLKGMHQKMEPMRCKSKQ